MNMSFKKLLISICVANFFALNLFMIFLVYLSNDFQYKSFIYQLEGYLTVAILFLIFGVLISFAATLTIGFPLYFLAKFLNLINLYTLICGGILIAVIPLLVCIYTGWNLPTVVETKGLFLLSNLAFCGGIGGFTYWKLGKDKI